MDPEFRTVTIDEYLASAQSPRVMTVDDVAIYLQVSPRKIYNLVAAGEIPAAKIGDQWRFFRPEIDRWLTLLSRKTVGDPTPVDQMPRGPDSGDL